MKKILLFIVILFINSFDISKCACITDDEAKMHCQRAYGEVNSGRCIKGRSYCFYPMYDPRYREIPKGTL